MLIKIVDIVNKLTRMLHEKKYDEIFRYVSSARFSKRDLLDILNYHKLNVGLYRNNMEKYLEYVKIDNRKNAYSVDIMLLNEDGEESDVTLELTVSFEGKNIIVELDDIHVL